MPGAFVCNPSLKLACGRYRPRGKRPAGMACGPPSFLAAIRGRKKIFCPALDKSSAARQNARVTFVQ
jgi:hypothetical protein